MKEEFFNENNVEIKSITAIERDGLSIRTLSMNFEILKPEVNLRDAVRKASTEYCNTVDGRKVYDYNCNSFNWADFWDNVPNAICEKYDIRKQDNIISTEDVDWDEHLVDDEMLTLTDDYECPACGFRWTKSWELSFDEEERVPCCPDCGELIEDGDD